MMGKGEVEYEDALDRFTDWVEVNLGPDFEFHDLDEVIDNMENWLRPTNMNQSGKGRLIKSMLKQTLKPVISRRKDVLLRQPKDMLVVKDMVTEKRRRKWLGYEVKVLERLWPKYRAGKISRVYVAQQLGRSPEGVRKKAKRLGL